MVGTPRSGKMSRDIRSTARKPTNATPITIVKSEIGRRNANDTRFIVTPQPVSPRRARPDGSNGDLRDTSEKCDSYRRPNAQPSRFNDLDRRAELGRRTVLECRVAAGPDGR